MGQIENLDTVVSAVGKMSKLMQAFDKVPEVLGILQSAQSTLNGLVAEEAEKERVIAKMDAEIEQKQVALASVSQDVKKKEVELGGLASVVESEKAKLVEQMNRDVGQRRVELETSLNDQLAAQRAALDTVRQEVATAEARHKAKMQEYSSLEADAKARADIATKNLEEIKQTLFKEV